MRSKIDVILPCFNANETWPDELLAFHKELSGTYDLSYIVVDDGSISRTPEAQAKRLQQLGVPIKVITYKENRGKGHALREGVKASASEYILYTDVDFPFTNDSARKLMDALLSGKFDIVAGYRDDSYYKNKISWFRKCLSRAFRGFLKSGLKLPLTDTQCGLKGFNTLGRKKFLATTIDRYLFDFEFIYRSVRDHQVRVGTVLVELKENVVFSKMRMKILAQESANLIRVLFSSEK